LLLFSYLIARFAGLRWTQSTVPNKYFNEGGLRFLKSYENLATIVSMI
jgi:hypothetical protein